MVKAKEVWRLLPFRFIHRCSRQSIIIWIILLLDAFDARPAQISVSSVCNSKGNFCYSERRRGIAFSSVHARTHWGTWADAYLAPPRTWDAWDREHTKITGFYFKSARRVMILALSASAGAVTSRRTWQQWYRTFQSVWIGWGLIDIMIVVKFVSLGCREEVPVLHPHTPGKQDPSQVSSVNVQPWRSL